MAGKVLADFIFRGSKGDGCAIDRDLPSTKVQANRAKGDGMRVLAPFPAHVSGNLRTQLGSAERLAYVVVGAEAIAGHGIFFGNLGSEEDDGSVEARTQLAHELEAVDAGHHHIA